MITECGKDPKIGMSHRIYSQPTYVYRYNDGTIIYLDHPISEYKSEVNLKDIPDDKRVRERTVNMGI